MNTSKPKMLSDAMLSSHIKEGKLLYVKNSLKAMKHMHMISDIGSWNDGMELNYEICSLISVIWLARHLSIFWLIIKKIVKREQNCRLLLMKEDAWKSASRVIAERHYPAIQDFQLTLVGKQPEEATISVGSQTLFQHLWRDSGCTQPILEYTAKHWLE